MGKEDLYLKLTQSYSKAYAYLTKAEIQKNVNKIWNEHKESKDLSNKIKALVDDYDHISRKREAKIRQFWASIPKKSEVEDPSDLDGCVGDNPQVVTNVSDMNMNCSSDCIETGSETVAPSILDTTENLALKVKYKTPTQDTLQKHIDLLSADLCGLYKRRHLGMLTSEQSKELKTKEVEKEKFQSKLKVRIRDQSRQKKRRAIAKDKIAKLMATVRPDNENFIKLNSNSGRPPVESNQPLLLQAICDIVIHGSGAHERRRCDVYRTIKTLDELLNELKKEGYQISRSALYLRLIPRNHLTTEGKRHKNTVPVKLIGAQNDKHESHVDGKFCTSTIRNLEELASLLGPNETFFLSQDDKAKVAIGVTAAKKQAPMIMHLEYKVTLPDHDFVVASKHKLTPSVYAGIIIKPNGFGKTDSVTYSGPTYIAIRSGKHSTSNALSHALDFETLLDLPDFENLTKFEGVVKPIVIFTTDGGPDENPRFRNVINVGISHFNKYNLDALFIASNAPGRSAYNRVERRMATLSNELAGVVLPYNHFGEHPNSKKETIDEEIEMKNFKYAGEALADIWSNVVIDKFATTSKYILPEHSAIEESSLVSKDCKWMSKHVCTSQYFTQIVKCFDRSCCSSPRSSYFKIFKDCQFLPALVPLEQTNARIVASSDFKNFGSLFLLKSLNIEEMLPSAKKSYREIPYDLFCPSIQSSLDVRICKKCNKYFASIVMLNEHIRFVHKDSPIIVPKIRPILNGSMKMMLIQVAFNKFARKELRRIKCQFIPWRTTFKAPG